MNMRAGHEIKHSKCLLLQNLSLNLFFMLDLSFQEFSAFSKPIWNRKRGKTDVRIVQATICTVQSVRTAHHFIHLYTAICTVHYVQSALMYTSLCTDQQYYSFCTASNLSLAICLAYCRCTYIRIRGAHTVLKGIVSEEPSVLCFSLKTISSALEANIFLCIRISSIYFAPLITQRNRKLFV